MYLFKNNATSTLRQDTPAASTTLTLPSGEGARFPAPVAPDLAVVTIEDRRTGQLEICTMTARVADVLTVIRAQEGTTAQLFYAGATVSNRMTAGTLAGIQTLGTFFYAGPYTVAQPPGPAPGAVGDAGQIMPNPIPPGTQYYNTGTKTIYVWDGTQWVGYTAMVPLDGHLAMIGDLQMGGHAVLSQGSGDHIAIDGGSGHAQNLIVDGNVNTVQTKRVLTHAAFPVAVPGQMVANIPDAQLAMGPGAGGVAVPLIAVRYFQPTATYDIGDHVVNAGVLVRAIVANGPGAYNGSQWASASGGLPEAPLDGTPYLRQGGAWVGPSAALVVAEAPNDGNEYVRQSLGWTLHDKTWAGVTGKPSVFPPSTHTHPISEVTALQTTLTTEQNARIAGDAALQTQVDTKVGPDAPSDGSQYARKDAGWEKVTGGAYIGATPPASPLPSSFYWSSTNGNLYIRYDDGNSAQWVQVNYAPLNAGYVLKAGDTMTGNLAIKPTAGMWSLLRLDKPASGVGAQIAGAMAGSLRWTVTLGDQIAESGSNAGSNFTLSRYNDAGAYVDNPLSIDRVNGNTVFGASVTVSPATGYANLLLNKPASGQANTLYGRTNNSERWLIYLGDATAESGSNAGSNFSIARCTDAGAFIDLPLTIERSTGVVTLLAALKATAYRCKPGFAGAYVTNQFNINYTTGAQLWIDNTNLGTISVTSDYRTKDNVEALPSMWEAVKGLRPVSFDWKEFGIFKPDGTEGPQYGFVAHELQEDLIHSAAGGEKDEEDRLQNLNLAPVVAALTKALQEAMARIEALEARS